MTNNRVVQALQNEAARLKIQADGVLQTGNYTYWSILIVQASAMDRAATIAASSTCDHDDEIMVYGCGDCGKNHPFWACHGPTGVMGS